MASYSAKIELIIQGQEKVKQLEREIDGLNKKLKNLTNLDVKGVFEDALTGGAVSKLREATREGVKAQQNKAKAQERANRAGVRQLRNQIQLNSAVDLYQRKLAQVGRTAAASQKASSERIEELNQAFEFFKGRGDVGGVRDVATELGRIVEYSRDVTRLEVQRAKSSQQIKDFAAQINELKRKGVDVSKAEEQLDKFKINAGTNQFKLAEQQGFLLKIKLRDLAKEVRLQDKITKQEQAKTKAVRAGRSKRFQNIATGAGFPLLFGGGPLQAIAGGIGGAFGGLGGSIAATAAVSQVQSLVQTVAEAGTALNSTGEALDFVREKSLFTSKEAEDLSYELEKLGDVEGLANLLTEELSEAIGNKGVQALKDLGDETDETQRLWNELTLQLKALIAGPLTEFLKIVNSVLGGITVRGRFDALKEELAGNKEFEAAVAERKRGKRRGAAVGTLGIPDMRALLEEFGPQRKLTARIPVTSADLRRFTGDKGKAEREEAGIQKRLQRLRAETALIKERAAFNEKIVAAEIAQDRQLVIRLQGEERIASILQGTRKELAGVTDERERSAILQKNAQKVAAAQKETVGELAKFEAERNRNFADTVRNLQFALEIQNATTIERQKQLVIEQEIANLRSGGQFTEDQLGEIQRLKEQANIGQVQTLVNDLTRQLNDTEGMIVSLAQTIEGSISSAMSSALTDVVNGTKSVQQVFSEMFSNIGKAFIDMATQMIAKALILKALGIFLPGSGGGGSGGFLPGSPIGIADSSGFNLGGFGAFQPRAKGGPVGAGSPYMVGERGPELFVPRSSGTIVPNNALGGGANVTVNVDASGSNVQGDSNQASQLGKAIGAAVQAELVKQKRPGGLLSGV